MTDLILYRKRIIPDECLLLKDDRILYMDSSVIVTAWRAIHPKPSLSSGFSCYYLDRGYKVSKFLRDDGSARFWYCDIVDYGGGIDDGRLVVTDLLADVVIYPDGQIRVVDLDELADAFEGGLIDSATMTVALRNLSSLLTTIYDDGLDDLVQPIEKAASGLSGQV